MVETLEQLKYPVGRFDWSRAVSKDDRLKAIRTIAGFPSRISSAVKQLDQSQIDTPYRTEGWTIRQVVHHCADSHLNAYIRFKLALTEVKPTINRMIKQNGQNFLIVNLNPEYRSLSLKEFTIDG